MGKENSFYPIKSSFLTNALKGSGNPTYPGGPVFDFARLTERNEESVNRFKISEVKNGRLAMIAVFGFGA